MATTKRQLILEAMRARLQAIQMDDGFETDAGSLVVLGETTVLGPDDPDAVVAIVVEPDEVRHTGENVFAQLPIEIQAIAKADLDQPWVAVEAVLGDIKRAIELEDRTLGGLVPSKMARGSTRTLERDEGSTVVGVGVTYIVGYAEGWGTP